MSYRGALRGGALLLGLLLLSAALLPSAGAAATFGIEPGSVKIETLDSTGQPDQRAGAHPDRLKIYFEFESSGGTGTRDLAFEFAPGMTGSPLATKTCSRTVFEFGNPCPEATQVGVFNAHFFGGESFDQPIYNITPGQDQLAALAFKPFWETELSLSVRPEDFGLSISTLDLPLLPFQAGYVELWGVPGDHNGAPPSEHVPFLTTPTECGPLHFKVLARSWEVGAEWVSEGGESEPFTGCGELPFQPSLGLHLTSSKPDSPTGARIDLNLPEHSGPEESTSANLKDVSIDLPPGLSVSPGGVEGRETCSDEQFGLGQQTPVSCPFHSRVGSVEVATSALSHNLVGSIFIGKERPGERFRLFVHASAPGVDYKSVAKLVADPHTGQLSAALNNLPQFSISQISLDFDGGPRALLATPVSCGPAPAHARFVPYSGGPAVESSTSVNIGPCAGPPPFSPGLTAGSMEPIAGQTTSFAVTLSRREGEQLAGKFTTTFPPGLSANLRAIDLCPSSAAAIGRCPDASKIGVAVGEVGSGPSPAKVPGAVYLTESYKDAPFGLSIVFRAAIGPFDFGTLNVRATLRVDPHTGQISIEHVLPAVFEGVPLRFRTIGIDLSRPGFLVNPTSCETEVLDSTVFSTDGRAAPVPDPFRVDGCSALGFRPKFSLALDQRGRHAAKPELSFAISMPKGQTNLKRFDVKFPPVLKFHNAGLKAICARAAVEEGRCSPEAQIGTAVAVSPLLRQPLRGPVYVVQPKGKGFPDLWSDVEGGGIELQLKSESTGKNSNLTTEMVDIPDLPLSSFTMHVNGGGKRGALFSVGGDACADPAALSTPIELEGHDGAVKSMKVQMQAGCAKSSRKKRSRAPSRGR